MRPARPGSREEKGGMALRVWVRHVAPERRPDSPWSSVAIEWPMDTRIPWEVKCLISAGESGSSGARVRSLTAEERLEEP